MKNTIITTSTFLFVAIAIIGCGGNKSTNPEEEEKKPVAETPVQDKVDYLKIGKDIAMQTKGSLGKYLIPALGSMGAEGAVEFCNTRAIPITDSMARVLSASIKRVSDKPRNPSNQANELELEYIRKWKEAKELGEALAPEVMEIDGKIVGYYPIVTNQMCMQCHGAPEKEINAATLAKINTLYPTDKATGYSAEEIRGLFVVGMDKKGVK